MDFDFSGSNKVIERDSSGFLSARTFDEPGDRRGKDPYSRSLPADRWNELRSGRDGGKSVYSAFAASPLGSSIMCR